MEKEQYCSRHFLGTQANILRSLPFAPPGNPSEQGLTTRHRLLALADWHEDSQVELFESFMPASSLLALQSSHSYNCSCVKWCMQCLLECRTGCLSVSLPAAAIQAVDHGSPGGGEGCADTESHGAGAGLLASRWKHRQPGGDISLCFAVLSS